MQTRFYFILFVLVSILATMFWQLLDWRSPSFQTEELSENEEIFESYNSEPIQPLPLETQLGKKKVILGERLFNDPRLSRNNLIACSSCHNLAKGGADSVAISEGTNDAVGNTNAPTVFNSSFNFAQFWDGRAATLEAQVLESIVNPLEMNFNWNELVPKLQADRDYQNIFKKITPGNYVNYENN